MQLRIIILSFLIFAVSGCSADDPTRHNTFIPLTSIQLTPAYQSMADKTVNQYTAIGDFSGAFTRDITTEVSWTIANGTVASVSNETGSEGLVTALLPGETSITATYGDFAQSTQVVVTNAFLTGIEIVPLDIELQAGITQQYGAAGIFSDDSVQDITTLATWQSSDTDVATIDSTGLATTIATGSSTISGAWQGIEASTSLMVSGATLTAITLTPAEDAVARGTTLQYAAEGTYSDNSTLDITDMVDWQSSATGIAIVTAGGLATGIVSGEAEISASYLVDGETITATAVLTITNAVIDFIIITPENSTIANGADQQFMATGIFSDGSEQDITDLASWFISR